MNVPYARIEQFDHSCFVIRHSSFVILMVFRSASGLEPQTAN